MTPGRWGRRRGSRTSSDSPVGVVRRGVPGARAPRRGRWCRGRAVARCRAADEQVLDEVTAAERHHGARVRRERLGHPDALHLEVVAGRVGRRREPLLEPLEPHGLGGRLVLDGRATGLRLLREERGPVREPALRERVDLVLLGELDRREPARLERRRERRRERDPGERRAPHVDAVGRQLGVDRLAQDDPPRRPRGRARTARRCPARASARRPGSPPGSAGPGRSGVIV